MNHPHYILTLACPDTTGIVYAVTGWLKDHSGNILDSAQFGDATTQQFFMRVHFQALDHALDANALRQAFSSIADPFKMEWTIADAAAKPRVLVLVSKIGHCLNDLLFRYSSATLPIEIAAIASNHDDFYQLAASHRVPFTHLAHHGATDKIAEKAAQEAKLHAIIREKAIDFVVLARFMQILSNDFCAQYPGRIINIHHSFLPSFKGAKPYHQAYDRGVKLIGATAHYVTADLDEGPIIEQGVERVDHSLAPAELTAVGRDVECVVLARAVKWHAERRVLLNGHRTVVFR